MSTKKCLIIEDDEGFIKSVLQPYIDKLNFIKIIGKVSSFYEAVVFLHQSKESLDIIFLDMELSDGKTGLDFLKSFEDLPPVVIMTSHSGFAVDSYELGKAVDYIVKPFSFDRFVLAVNRSLKMSTTSHVNVAVENFVYLKMGRRFQKFEMNDIDYVKAFGIYVKVFSKGVTHVINETISTIESSLDSKNFIRVHKSFIVNISKVISFESNKLILKNDEIPVGRFYRPNLDDLYKLFND